MTSPAVRALIPGPNDTGYVMQFGQVAPFGLPLMKPPYGRITALDMNQGTKLWTRPNGGTPREVRNHPMLRGMQLPDTGSRAKAGLLVTKTLLFAGEGWGGQPYFRALDKATGEVLWETKLPGIQAGLPMSYMHKGVQYVVMSVGDQDANMPAEIVAFSLVDKPAPKPGTTAMALPVAALSPTEQADGWKPLFPGPAMAGWYSIGGAEWAVADGVLTGTGKGGPSYLRSTAAYDNFELALEFEGESTTNSGVLLRCPLSDLSLVSQRSCYEVNLADATDVYPTGSIMDVMRVSGTPRTAGTWNRLHVTADGTHLTVAINGVVVTDAWDDKLRGGTIALQAVGGGGPIRFRNARIRKLAP